MFIYLFLERGEGREKERERNIIVWVDSCAPPPTRDLGNNPAIYSDWELNQQLFVSQAGTQSTEPYQPGQKLRNVYLFSVFEVQP